MARQIPVPVVLQPRSRNLWSENGLPNGIQYAYCAEHCLSAGVHCGHDVEAIFEPIFAATDGVVKFAGFDGFYTPRHVDIEPIVGPFRGEYHIYGHLSEAWVATGQRVMRGQQIGITGTNCIDSQCSALDVGNEHLHWERRGVPGFNGCSLDPDPVLTNSNANGDGGGGGDGGQGAAFNRQDMIGVSDGPLRLREGPGSGFAILQDLPSGAQLCVTGEPESSEGFDWYPVRVININQPGWVASQFCALISAGGCAGVIEAVQTPVPKGAAKPGQPIKAHEDSGPPAEISVETAARMPEVVYDANGVFVGVTFPSTPSETKGPAAQRDAPNSPPWAKG